MRKICVKFAKITSKWNRQNFFNDILQMAKLSLS